MANGATVHVVDGFYSDPDRVRNLALEETAWVRAAPAAGGKHSSESERSFYTADLVARFVRILGFDIAVDAARMGFGVFAFYGSDAQVEQTTHFDDTEWAGVVYLAPPERCEGGLSFYRHRETGLCGPPTTPELSRLGIKDLATFLRDVYYPSKKDPDAWEETMHVDMKYNRLVLLEGGRLFHRASSGFGTSPADGRLSQRFFFNSKGARDAV